MNKNYVICTLIVMLNFVFIQASDVISLIEQRNRLALEQADAFNPVLDSRYSGEQLKELEIKSSEIAYKLQLAFVTSLSTSPSFNAVKNKQQKKPFDYLRRKKPSLFLSKVQGFHAIEQIKATYTRVERNYDYSRVACKNTCDSDVDSERGDCVSWVFRTEVYNSDVDSDEKGCLDWTSRKGFGAEFKNHETNNYDAVPAKFVFQYLTEQPCPYKCQKQYMCKSMDRPLKKEARSKDAMAYSTYILALMRLSPELWGEVVTAKASSGLRLIVANLMQHPTLYYMHKYDSRYAQQTLTSKNVSILCSAIVKKQDDIEWLGVPSGVQSLRHSQANVTTSDGIVRNSVKPTASSTIQNAQQSLKESLKIKSKTTCKTCC